MYIPFIQITDRKVHKLDPCPTLEMAVMARKVYIDAKFPDHELLTTPTKEQGLINVGMLRIKHPEKFLKKKNDS